jgi:sulfatase-like protein
MCSSSIWALATRWLRPMRSREARSANVGEAMLTRREVLFAGAATTAGTAHAASAQQPAANAKPNILFILAADLGWGDLSCYGRPDYNTPVLDDLAARGIRLTQAYANSSTCSPTRVALITGRYQTRLPVGLYDPLPGGAPAGLPPQHPTLPSLLRAAGYRTALIGKWHLEFPPAFGPLKSGYDDGREHGRGHRARPQSPGGVRTRWQHDRRVHERQRRRALLVSLAVPRREGLPVGTGPATSPSSSPRSSSS